MTTQEVQTQVFDETLVSANKSISPSLADVKKNIYVNRQNVSVIVPGKRAQNNKLIGLSSLLNSDWV